MSNEKKKATKKAVKPVKAPAITSTFAILDVKKGRKQFSKLVSGGHRFKAKIEMVIDRQHGHDDGVSIEFSGEVTRVEIEPMSGQERMRDGQAKDRQSTSWVRLRNDRSAASVL